MTFFNFSYFLLIVTSHFIAFSEHARSFWLLSWSLFATISHSPNICPAMMLVPFVEPPFQEEVGLFGTAWPCEVILLVVASCLTAFFINLTIYWIIGNTSPVTYNMFGHFKFVCTMIGGYVLFQAPLNFRQFIGIILTCIGIGFYTKFKLEENKLMQKKTELPK